MQVAHNSVLPTAKEDGLVMNLKQEDQKLLVKVTRPSNSKDNFKLIRIVATMHKQMVYRVSTRLVNAESYNGEIPIANLPEGVFTSYCF
jgi:hypothetical protein